MKPIKLPTDYVVFSEDEKKSAINCLENSDTSIFVSRLIPEFEKNLSDFVKSNFALTVPNCTLALYASLQVLDIKSGDEVIVPNLTHASSIYPIIMSGAKIKVCNFEEGSYNYDINHLKSLLSSKTKAVLVCYLYGMPLNIEKISSVCKEHNVFLIEDCAQSFGTQINGKYTGTFGDVGCYSFNDTKMLRIGEGGAVVTNFREIAKKIEQFRHVGEVFTSNKKSSVHENSTYGDLLVNGLSNVGRALNLRPSPICFSTGIERLKNINKFIQERQKKLKVYMRYLSEVEGMDFINNLSKKNVTEYAPLACWLVLDSKIYDRNKLILGLINMGIPVGSFNYDTIIKKDYFNKYILNLNDDFTESQYIRDNSIFLPLYENLTEEDIVKICQVFKYVISKYSEKNNQLFDKSLYNKPIEYFDGFYLMRKIK